MIRALTLVTVILAPSLAVADVTIRNGNHADFIRIVLTMHEGAEWSVGKIPGGYGISFADGEVINASGFFDRIPKDRIAAVSLNEAGNTLAMEIACECSIQASPWQSDKLIVDIRDGAPDPTSPFEVPLDIVLSTDSLVENFAANTDDLADLELPIFFQDQLQSGLAVEPALEDLLDQPIDLDQVAMLEGLFVENIGRAASQGLLTPSTAAAPETTPRYVEGESFPVEQTTEMDLSGANFPEMTSALPGLRIQTSIDRGVGDLEAPPLTQGGFECWSDEHFAVGDWATEEDFSSQISMYRTQITGEFDRLDEQAIVELAQMYAHFGFGREARQTLGLDGTLSPERFAIISIAQIVDGDPVQPTLPTEQMSCEGPVALWAFLAEDPRDLTVGVNTSAILRAFRSLPIHLQLNLGSRLSGKFIAIGDLNSAEQALVNSNRQPELSVGTVIAQSRVDTELGDDETAVIELTQLAETSGRMTPEALVELLALNLKNESATEPDLLMLAAALRFENTGLPVAGDLAVAEVETFLQSGEFDVALEILNSARSEIGGMRTEILQDGYALSITEKSTDAEFAAFAFQKLNWPLSTETQNAVAERLLEIGFPETAQLYLSTPAIGSTMAERRYLRAQAAIGLGRGDEVDAILAGVSSERATKLRKSGAARQAGYALDDAVLRATDGQDFRDVAAENSLRLGDWRTLAANTDELLAAASELAVTAEEINLQSSQPLADGRNLLEQSSNTREVLDALLNRFESLPVEE
jgi:hypothetical protein